MELSQEMGFELTVTNGEFSEKKAREITLQLGRNMDVIACGSDLMAIGAMKALTDMNVFHPVCGFDGITLMGYAGKNMTTVRQDFSYIGEEALRECIRLMSGEPGKTIRVPYSLMQVRYEDVLN
jgi:LacI family transcriptional regulator